MRVSLILLLSFVLHGCVSVAQNAPWPAGIPPRQHFTTLYAADKPNQAHQTQDQYLEWVVRFYEGSEFMAFGWNAIAESVLVDLEAGQRASLAQQLHALGTAISGEWAKGNQVRQIDTAMLSLWGAVMQVRFRVPSTGSAAVASDKGGRHRPAQCSPRAGNCERGALRARPGRLTGAMSPCRAGLPARNAAASQWRPCRSADRRP